ncbi:MAG: glycosyltransferase family 39 protein [Verrucomicrobiales bacterium]
MAHDIQSKQILPRAVLAGVAVAMACLGLALADVDMQRGWTASVEKWTPVGAGAAAFIFVCLALFWPWLARQPDEEPRSTEKKASWRDVAGVEWLVLGLIVMFALILNLPRMKHPLWGDEERTARNYVVGQYKPADGNKVKWRACTWGDTFFDYQSPNNHGFYSFLARLAQHDREEGIGPTDLPFKEWKLRLPALAGSVLAILVVWWLARSQGWKIGAPAAALIMAAHPWFVRYSTEARGYGILFFLIPLAVLLATRALTSRGWGWWFGLAVTQALLFSTWMMQLHWLIALNLGIIISIATWPEREWRPALFRRWLVAGSCAAALVLPIQLPAAMQLAAWMEDGKAVLPSGFLGRWVADVASTLFTGETWYSPDPANYLCPWRSAAIGRSLLYALLPAILLMAGVAAWRGQRERAVVLATALLPLVLVFTQSAVKDSVVIHWYASPVWPLAALLMGSGLQSLVSGRGKAAIPLAIIIGMLAIAPWQNYAHLLRSHPIENTLEAALLTRRVLNPNAQGFGKDSITAAPQLGRPAYDPLARKADTVGELKELMEDAATAGLPLFVNAGDPKLLQGRNPEMWAMLADPMIFEKPTEFPGMDGPQRRVIWKWTGRMPP